MSGTPDSPSAADRLRERTRFVLGPDGVRRFGELAAYDDGLAPLSDGAVTRMENFLGAYDGFPATPELSAGVNGGLVLSWDRAAGDPVSIAFNDDGFHVVFSARGEEHRTTRLPDVLQALVLPEP